MIVTNDPLNSKSHGYLATHWKGKKQPFPMYARGCATISFVAPPTPPAKRVVPVTQPAATKSQSASTFHAET